MEAGRWSEGRPVYKKVEGEIETVLFVPEGYVSWEISDSTSRTSNCTDGSDLYRPIKQASNNGVERNSSEKGKPSRTAGDRNSAEPAGGEASKTQTWKTSPSTEKDYNRKYKGKEEWENATRDEPSTLWFIPQTDPFKVPAITTEEFEKGPYHDKSSRYEEKFANFYSSDDYVKDETTNLMMAPITEETCKASDGFVCMVRLLL